MKTILAAIDSSSISESVLAAAAELARTNNGRIVVLTVVQPPIITSEYAPLIENVAALAEAADKAARDRLAEIKARLAAEEIAVDTVPLNGAPVANILEQAERHAADYIVMGSHGHTAVYDLLVGSTTHGVLLRANCPVVIVPPKKGRKRAS